MLKPCISFVTFSRSLICAQVLKAILQQPKIPTMIITCSEEIYPIVSGYFLVAAAQPAPGTFDKWLTESSHLGFSSECE